MATVDVDVFVSTGVTVTTTVKVFPVGSTSAVEIGWCPAGRTVLIQNLGAKAVTVGNTTPLLAGKGFNLVGGTPGGSMGTGFPGAAKDQYWYARTSTGTTTVAFMVV